MLQPMDVIIHDFPKFVSEAFDSILFAHRAKIGAGGKVNVKVKPGDSKTILFRISTSITVRFAVFAVGYEAFSLDASSTALMRLKAKLKDKLFKLNTSIPISMTKTYVRATGISQLFKLDMTLDPGKYFIGVPLTLGHWDGEAGSENTLGDLDDLTIQDMSILET